MYSETPHCKEKKPYIVHDLKSHDLREAAGKSEHCTKYLSTFE
jgi:hypothetical protein